MSKQEDKAQQMIDEGLISGRDDNKPPRADDPVVQELVRRMDECDDASCNQTGPHVHLVMKRPEGLDMSNGELQALMQKKFNDQVNKLMREVAGAEFIRVKKRCNAVPHYSFEGPQKNIRNGSVMSVFNQVLVRL